MSTHLAMEKLAFRYGAHQVLKELSLKVERGVFLAIVGPNGSGKSTLLKNLSAVLTPAKGKVFLDGEDLYRIGPKALAKKLAVVPQDTTVQFPFTVEEVVLMGRMPHQERFQGDTEKDFKIVQQSMERTNTWHLRERNITELSGGERQRVIVARALAQEPQILLLDEPTAHLDLQHQMELLNLLQGLKNEGQVTILAVFHDLNLAAQFSEFVILLHQGKIYASGTPAEVLTPANLAAVYGMEVVVIPNELTGRFNIIPVALTDIGATAAAKKKFHLICGGGTGNFLMEQLVQQGHQVSCGVLNIGDSDWSKAKALGLPLAEEMPFAGIQEESYKKNWGLLLGAQGIIVLPIPFGPGNIGNLRQALEAHRLGKKVILVGEIDGRDFTNGAAAAFYQELIKGGAKKVFQTFELLPLLREF
ncbi:MAG: heme ABC transporter ATP-binding protein [Bacillota bacterium]